MDHSTVNISANNLENTSDILNVSSYSLQDDSREIQALENEDLLLSKAVLDQLDNPYSQLYDRLHVRKGGQYDGFDSNAGGSWIYPTNYPLRQYQFTITKAALFKNTLVVLPTGLGKTFIAAVVMYNIYRWYPMGKVIFMAPTRPLVGQQTEACYNIMGIPKSDTVEITGKQLRKNRTSLWQSKRVFYATPQVVLADLHATEQNFPVEQVRLIVIDEAHKAKGRYAYTEVIRMIAARNPHFRVLALSATPGRTLEDVAEVIKNLLISHIEVRWENSIDVLPYTFRKDVRTIVIPHGTTIRRIREELLHLVDPYLRRLLEANVFSRYPSTVTRGILIMEQKRFRMNAMRQRHPNHSAIMADFGVCISMYHALELLVRHGIRALLNFFADGGSGGGHEKYFVAKDVQIKTFLTQLREQFPTHPVDDETGTGDDIADFGHPKFRILEKQLTKFFTENTDSKAIVFCEFRDSVAMIKRILNHNQPLIRPKCIVGQGSTNGIRAVTQQEQVATMRQFRNGTCNTLIATCIAEEGIDVGEVDLIVCFDIAKNPMRFVQRIGRTGRRRIGRVLMLVTEGQEHDTLKKVMASKDKTNQELARSKDILRILYRHSPRLVPPEFEPKCWEMFIDVREADKQQDPSVDHNSSVENPDEPTDQKGTTKRPRATGESSDTPKSKRKKILPGSLGQRDVRTFFQRNSKRADDLNESDHDIFSVKTPNRSVTSGNDRSHLSSVTPVDESIRKGHTDEEIAIRKRLKPLVHHYEMLRRQKYIHRQQLLDVPTIEQILSRKTIPVIRQQLVRALSLGRTTAGHESREVPVALDNLLDLPELVPYERPQLDHQPTQFPSQPCARPVLPEMDFSVSKLFDSSFDVCDLPLAVESPSVKPNDITTVLMQANTKATPVSVGRKSHVSKASKTKVTSPANSPILLAFNRSVKKRKNSDLPDTPVPTPQARRMMMNRMVLEYFHLRRLDDIFDNDDDDDNYDLNTERKENDIKPGVNVVPIGRKLFPALDAKNWATEVADMTALGINELNNLPTSLKNAVLPVPCRSTTTKKIINLGTAASVFDESSNDSCQSLFARGSPSPEPEMKSNPTEIVPSERANTPPEASKGRQVARSAGGTRENHDVATWDEDEDMFKCFEKDQPVSIYGSKKYTVVPEDNDVYGQELSCSLIDEIVTTEESKPVEIVLQRNVDIPESKDECSNDSSQSLFSRTSSSPGAERKLPPVENVPSTNVDDQPESSKDIAKLKLHRLRLENVKRDTGSPVDTTSGSSPYFATCRSQLPATGNERDEENQPGNKDPDSSPNEEVSCSGGVLDTTVNIGCKPRRGVAKPIYGESDEEDESSPKLPTSTEGPRGKKNAVWDDDDNDNDVFQCFETAQSCFTGQSKKDSQIQRRNPAGRNPTEPKPGKRHRKANRNAAGFFLTQAAVSDDDENEADEETHLYDGMNSLVDFVTDSNSEEDTVDMRSVYLQSVRSPILRRGTVKIPSIDLERPQGSSGSGIDAKRYIYEVSDDNDEDGEKLPCSFIDNDVVTVDSELSELEQAERKLQEVRRKAKRARKKANGDRNPGEKKRRRIILKMNSDSE